MADTQTTTHPLPAMPWPSAAIAESADRVAARLVACLNPDGHWEGRLSSSALATAVACLALAEVDANRHRAPIQQGLEWLARTQNPDGGWGDSPECPSNISTTLLAWSALARGDRSAPLGQAARRAHDCVVLCAGTDEPHRIAAAVAARYGEDRTFAAPILTACALAGRLGPEPQAWQVVPQLPFELAAVPRDLYRWLQLPVVSYAIPALVAIGLVRHQRASAAGDLRCGLRNLFTERCLRVLAAMQPSAGGFLEATPLTGFVVMSLAAAGKREHRITALGAEFLVKSMRPDGSWPIDTNLATWVTTLAVNAIADTSHDAAPLTDDACLRLRGWLIAQQGRGRRHPYSGAAPGGWAWTDLPGAVPDADDTAGALLALRRLGSPDTATSAAADAGTRWLLDLQNRDGGMPTFCRGWGRLPFDRSGPDLTAHALRAFAAWRNDLGPDLRLRTDEAVFGSLRYLAAAQRADGAWLPLWFGNLRAPSQANPVYGTARVIEGLDGLADPFRSRTGPLVAKAVAWLRSVQQPDGGWGGAPGVPPSVEETALALVALASHGPPETIARGLSWLAQHTEGFTVFPTTPIGLYFASLWYAEELYPLIFTAGALQRCRHGGPAKAIRARSRVPLR